MTSIDDGLPQPRRPRLGYIVRGAVLLLDRFEWLLVLGLAPFLLLPSMERIAFVAVLPIVWVAAGIARRRLLLGTPLDWPLALMGFMVLVSAAVTYDLSLSLPKIAGMVLGLAVFRVTGNGRRSVLLPVGLLIAIGCGIAAMSILVAQWAAKVPLLAPILAALPRAAISSIPGTDVGVNPNEVAGALLWVAPVSFALLAASLRARRRLLVAIGGCRATLLIALLAGATALTMGTLVLTQSRSAYVGITVTAAITTLVLLPRRWRIALVAGGAIVALAGVVLLLNGAAGATIASWLGGQSTGASAALTSLDQRVEVWSRAIYGLEDFPFTGMGMNTFRRIVHVLYPLFLISPDVDIAHAHNEFLQAGLDLGLPGLVAFVSIYMATFWMLWQTWRLQGRAGCPDTAEHGLLVVLGSPAVVRALVAGLAAGLFAHMVYGLTDAVALGAKPGVIFWFMVGLSSRLYLRTAGVAPVRSRALVEAVPEAAEPSEAQGD